MNRAQAILDFLVEAVVFDERLYNILLARLTELLSERLDYEDFRHAVASDDVLAPYVRIAAESKHGEGGYYGGAKQLINIVVYKEDYDRATHGGIVASLTHKIAQVLKHEVVHFTQHQRSGFSPEFGARKKTQQALGTAAYYDQPHELMAYAATGIPISNPRWLKYRAQYAPRQPQSVDRHGRLGPALKAKEWFSLDQLMGELETELKKNGFSYEPYAGWRRDNYQVFAEKGHKAHIGDGQKAANGVPLEKLLELLRNGQLETFLEKSIRGHLVNHEPRPSHCRRAG